MFATRALVALGTLTVADTGISKPGGAGEFLGLRFVLMPSHIHYGFFK